MPDGKPGEQVGCSKLQLLIKTALPVVVLLTLISSACLPAQAQTVTGNLSGSVVDALGAVVPGASVTVRNTSNGNVRSVKTNNAGTYAVPALPAADYQVKTEAAGFAESLRDLTLALGQDLVLNMTLTVASAEAHVLIESGAGTLQQESAELSGVIGRKQILELPLNGRSYGQLALLEPGVVSTTNRSGGVARKLGININGAGSRSNNFLLDGTSAVDAYNVGVGNAVGNFLGVDAVQEFRVLTNAYSAQYGGASGGVISIITKSGTNEFHGTGFEFLRNDNLDARNFFDPSQKPEFKRNQFGFAVGGPIVKDRTFFFGTGEWLRERLGQTIITTVPSLSARQGPVNPLVVPYLNAFFPLPNGRDFGDGLAELVFGFKQNTDETYWQGRIDHKFSENNTFFGRYTFDDAERNDPTSYPLLVDAFSSRNQYLTLEDTHVINPTMVNTARLSFTRTRFTNKSAETSPVSPGLSFLPGKRLGGLTIGGMPTFGQSETDTPQNVFSLSDDVTLVKGSHSLQWGVLLVRQQLNLRKDDRLAPGQYTFTSVQQFLAGNPSRLQIGLESAGSAAAYLRSSMFGGYFQDAFKVRRNVTLNLGLRLEFSTVPKEKYGFSMALPDPLRDTTTTVGQIFENRRQNWAPRVGLAWDVGGDSTTVLRGGFGIFYDINPVPFFITGGALTNNPPFNETITILNPPFPHPNLSGVTRTGLVGLFPLAYDWQTPHALQYNAALERALGPNTVFSVAYAGSRGIDLLRSGDVNLAVPQILANGQPFFAAGRPRRNPSFSSIDLKRTNGDSWYNAMLLKIRSRLHSNLQVQGSYTFSRSIDSTSGATSVEAVGSVPQVLDPEWTHLDRGLSDFHRKHNLVANFTWELPFGKGKQGLAKALLADWGMSGIFTTQTGNPFTPGIQGNWSRNLNSRSGIDRPSVAPGCTADNAILGGPDQYFNPDCFILPTRGTYGNLGRNVLIGPGLSTVDISFNKQFRIHALGEGGKLQFQTDFFNILNHANFNMPARLVFSGASPTERPLSTAGRITSTSTTARQLQLGLRVSW